MATSQIEQAKKSLTKKLSGFTGILGVGIGVNESGNPSLMVLLVADEQTPEIPTIWEGFPVIVESTDRPRAQK